MDVAILVFDGFDELDAIGPYEVIQKDATRGVDLNVGLYGPRDGEWVTAAYGLHFETDDLAPRLSTQGCRQRRHPHRRRRDRWHRSRAILSRARAWTGGG